jgi:hypothetical protein
LHSAVVTIGGLPMQELRVGEALDAALAEALGSATGIDSSRLRTGMGRLRSDGYSLAWRSESGELTEVWPAPIHQDSSLEDD